MKRPARKAPIPPNGWKIVLFREQDAVALVRDRTGGGHDLGIISFEDGRCTCDDFTKRYGCRHIRALRRTHRKDTR